jgi:hypothetical protein
VLELSVSSVTDPVVVGVALPPAELVVRSTAVTPGNNSPLHFSGTRPAYLATSVSGQALMQEVNGALEDKVAHEQSSRAEPVSSPLQKEEMGPHLPTHGPAEDWARIREGRSRIKGSVIATLKGAISRWWE